VDTHNLSLYDLLTILRGQLTLLRLRAERDIAISRDAIERAELLARALVSRVRGA
jgi:hypothetical protein